MCTLCDHDWICNLALNIDNILFVTHYTPSRASLFFIICPPLQTFSIFCWDPWCTELHKTLGALPYTVVMHEDTESFKDTKIHQEGTKRTLKFIKRTPKSIKRAPKGHRNPSRGHWKDTERHQEDTENPAEWEQTGSMKRRPQEWHIYLCAEDQPLHQLWRCYSLKKRGRLWQRRAVEAIQIRMTTPKMNLYSSHLPIGLYLHLEPTHIPPNMIWIYSVNVMLILFVTPSQRIATCHPL